MTDRRSTVTKTRIARGLAAAAMAFGLAAPASAAGVLINGGFEDPAAGTGLNGAAFADLAAPGGRNWDIFTSLPGWTATSGDGIEVQTAATLPGIDPQAGAHYVELDSNNNSAMRQTVALAAGQWQLRFWYAPRTGDANTNGIDYSVSGGLLSGATAGPSPTYPQNVWTEVVADFAVTTPGSYDLIFAATLRDDSFGGLLDTISLTQISQATVVPLPAPILLLGGALGGLALMRRRGRSAPARG
jgi:hypothetical protein